jgi:heme exporter protein C
MWWKIFIYLLMTAVIVAAFVAPTPMNPRTAVGDAEVYRLFYFHVPQSWVATLAFLIGMYQSIRLLQTKKMDYDLKAVTANRLGLLFTVLAVLTGSIFAKMTWGEFWNWTEIREVSIFILLLIYGAYFALRSALPNRETRATLSAVMSIIFAASAVFLIFILPRVYAAFSQHPTDSIVDRGGAITMGPTVRYIFLAALVAFTLLFSWLYNLAVRIYRLHQKRITEI